MVRRFTLLTSNPLQSIRKMDVFTTPSYFKQRLDTKRFFLAKLLGVEEAKIFIAETDSSIAFQALLTSLQEEGLVAMYGGAKAFEDYPPLCIIGLFYYLDKTIRKDFAMRSWGFTYPFEKKDKVFAKCLGETLERHAFYFLQGSTVHEYPHFKERDVSSMFPLCATLGTVLQAVKTSDDLKQIRCMRVRSLTGGPMRYLPYTCLYWCPLLEGEKVLREPNTNGGGGGMTQDDALLSGLYEFIERDHFLLYWLAGKQPRIIAHEDMEGDFGDYLKKVTQNYLLEVYFLDVSYDTHTQAVVAIVIDPVLNMISMGSKASSTAENSMQGALLEALAVLSFVRERETSFSEEKLSFYLDRKRNLKIYQSERMGMYCSKKGIEIVRKHFLLGETISLSLMKEKDRVFATKKEELLFLQQEFERLVKEKGDGYHVYYQSAKTKWTKKEGYHVVKTYIPSFLCFYLDEKMRPVFSERLEMFKKEKGVVSRKGQPEAPPHFLG